MPATIAARPAENFLENRIVQPNRRRNALRYWLQHSTNLRKAQGMKKQPRWMKSAIAASNEPQIALPWARGQRRRPEAMKPAEAPKTRAIAAR